MAANRLAMGSLRRASAMRGPIAFGSLRRTVSISWLFGYDRGHPVDRFYIERFLAENDDRVLCWARCSSSGMTATRAGTADPR